MNINLPSLYPNINFTKTYQTIQSSTKKVADFMQKKGITLIYISVSSFLLSSSISSHIFSNITLGFSLSLLLAKNKKDHMAKLKKENNKEELEKEIKSNLESKKFSNFHYGVLVTGIVVKELFPSIISPSGFWGTHVFFPGTFTLGSAIAELLT